MPRFLHFPSFLPSCLPSFLSLSNDVFPAIGFPCEQWLGGRTRRRGKKETHVLDGREKQKRKREKETEEAE